jgi:Raf kinase inhibitor-like YbhB/YbcL family protein
MFVLQHAARRARGILAFAVGIGFMAGVGVAAADLPFKLESSAVPQNGTIANDQVFKGFGCTGKNISPPLRWTGAPSGTKSFALTVYDPDAPTGSGWWHWVVANIPGSCRSLPRGSGSGQAAMPPGVVQARNDYSRSSFGGAAPPPGPPHRYIWTVNALKVDLIDVTPDSSGALVGFMVTMNKLASAQLLTRYGV